jgi:hypothetical protein
MDRSVHLTGLPTHTLPIKWKCSWEQTSRQSQTQMRKLILQLLLQSTLLSGRNLRTRRQHSGVLLSRFWAKDSSYLEWDSFGLSQARRLKSRQLVSWARLFWFESGPPVEVTTARILSETLLVWVRPTGWNHDSSYLEWDSFSLSQAHRLKSRQLVSWVRLFWFESARRLKSRQLVSWVRFFWFESGPPVEVRTLSKLDHGRFLPYPSQFTAHWSVTLTQTLQNWPYWRRLLKNTHKDNNANWITTASFHIPPNSLFTGQSP